MADNITKGKWNQFKGKVREETAKLTGDKSQEIRGEAEQVAGKVQEEYGKAKRNIKKAKDKNLIISSVFLNSKKDYSKMKIITFEIPIQSSEKTDFIDVTQNIKDFVKHISWAFGRFTLCFNKSSAK
jgi:uncharacterized protein YjbJ (UPF0337 family)